MVNKSALLGAAFLMATSAIGPGFLTQTATFTGQLLASFGFVILISIILDVGAQLNIWRIVGVAKKRGMQIANEVFPGLGYLVAFLIVLGGFAFNIGNISGAATWNENFWYEFSKWCNHQCCYCHCYIFIQKSR